MATHNNPLAAWLKSPNCCIHTWTYWYWWSHIGDHKLIDIKLYSICRHKQRQNGVNLRTSADVHLNTAEKKTWLIKVWLYACPDYCSTSQSVIDFNSTVGCATLTPVSICLSLKMVRVKGISLISWLHVSIFVQVVLAASICTKGGKRMSSLSWLTSLLILVNHSCDLSPIPWHDSPTYWVSPCFIPQTHPCQHSTYFCRNCRSAFRLPTPGRSLHPSHHE